MTKTPPKNARDEQGTALTVTMTKDHAMAVNVALEFLERASMGDWRDVAATILEEHGGYQLPDFSERVDMLAEHLRAAITPDMHRNAHKGIANASKRAKLGYEVQSQMKQAIAKYEQHGSQSVWHYGAMSYTGLPLPTVSMEARQ